LSFTDCPPVARPNISFGANNSPGRIGIGGEETSIRLVRLGVLEPIAYSSLIAAPSRLEIGEELACAGAAVLHAHEAREAVIGVESVDVASANARYSFAALAASPRGS